MGRPGARPGMSADRSRRRARRHRAAVRLAPRRAARPPDPRRDRGRRLLRRALVLPRPGRALRPARRAAGRAPARGRHADRHQRDLAVPRAAQDHADGGVPGRPAGGPLSGLGLRRAGPLHAREEAGAAAGGLEHAAVLPRHRLLLLLRLRPGLHLHPVVRAEERLGDAGHRGLPQLRADDVHRLRRRVRGADRRRRAGAARHGEHRQAEVLPQLLHRPGVHHRRGR